MSIDKTKRQERRSRTQVAVDKQVAICRLTNAVLRTPLGVFRKRKAMNCGRARCKLCTNPRRLWGHVTFPEKRANEAFHQALAELA